MGGNNTSMHDFNNFVGMKSNEHVESEVALMAVLQPQLRV